MTATKDLTAKQREVLRLLEAGQDPAAIAKRLKISSSGVYGHMRNIRRAGVQLPSERLDEPATLTEPSGRTNGVIDADVEGLLRSKIEEGRTKVAGIDAEVEKLIPRVEELREARNSQVETIARHERALALYFEA